ncbi:MAG: enoyl-CoA hydratase/isomerase family protein [Deltaproteobacteria bacterium]|nr:enoyl-CoA hydratase/isomerase family protein [Deltaproteobacteria bacterium]
MGVLIETNRHVARITLDRPPLNVLGIELLKELDSILERLTADTSTNVVVVQGGGGRAFSAGVDVRDHTRERVPEMLRVVHGVMHKFLALPQITIALVRGACLGGGLELASCCDLILASTDSVFGTPEINVGCYPPAALVGFPALLGYHRAAELILTGQRISAEQAAAIGLINRAVPRQELDEALEALLAELGGKSAAVLRISLKGLREMRLRTFAADLARAEEIYLGELLKTEDVEEGVRAFIDKRKPDWKHR